MAYQQKPSPGGGGTETPGYPVAVGKVRHAVSGFSRAFFPRSAHGWSCWAFACLSLAHANATCPKLVWAKALVAARVASSPLPSLALHPVLRCFLTSYALHFALAPLLERGLACGAMPRGNGC